MSYRSPRTCWPVLGVHRPTISEAAEALRARGLITYRRGKIATTDWPGLERASCEHSAEFRQVYEQLLGPAPGLRSRAALQSQDPRFR
jgi:DNA-binding transcriptional MocR family regulator